MRKVLWMLASWCAFASAASGQEMASGVYADFADAEAPWSETIIVTARRDQLPLAYEEIEAARPSSTFVIEEGWGVRRFERVIPLWTFSEGFGLEYSDVTVIDAIGRDGGAPERSGDTFRLRCRTPILTCLD